MMEVCSHPLRIMAELPRAMQDVFKLKKLSSLLGTQPLSQSYRQKWTGLDVRIWSAWALLCSQLRYWQSSATGIYWGLTLEGPSSECAATCFVLQPCLF